MLSEYIMRIKKVKPGYLNSKEQHDLVNLAELIAQIALKQEARISELEDLVNNLQGEQGKPKISAKNQKEESPKDEKNYSSEVERKGKKAPRKAKGKKFEGKTIDETDTVDIAQTTNLPADAVFQGYRTSHYYDFRLESKLIAVKRKVYYSATRNEYYCGELPKKYAEGTDYTYNLQETVFRLKYKYGMSSPFILELLKESGVDISLGTVSNMLLSIGKKLSGERTEIHQTGIESGLYTATDTTLDRYRGENHHAHIFCNEWFTTYYTRSKKDRQTIIDLFRSGKARIYLLNEDTIGLCQYLKVSKKAIALLENKVDQTVRNKEEFTAFLEEHLSDLKPKAFESCQKRIYEAAYLAAFHQEQEFIMLSDNAPQYNFIALTTALCWVHAGRHLKKLNPVLETYQKSLKDFLLQFWMYYDWLLGYQEHPTVEDKERLIKDFDAIFSITTNYDLLDDRIAKIKTLKDKLLVVLDNPDLPLHNNGAELAARRQVRYRDISFQTRSEEGRNAKNIALSIYQTCKKLGVDATQYILDRLTNKMEMLSLAHLIRQRNYTPAL